MELNKETRDMSRSAQLILLIGYTVLIALYFAATFLLGWEKWILVIVGAGLIASWAMHISSVFEDLQRIRIISGFVLCSFFIYGTHLTNTYDLAVVMASLMLFYILIGVRGLITMCQITYYITMTYALIVFMVQGGTFDALLVGRTFLHYIVITALAIFGRYIISRWKQVIHASEDEIEELTEATERLNDFLANVSHEIRTPVNAVIGLSGICIDKERDPEVKKDMESVRNAGRRVAEQIGDILDFSEIDRGRAVKNSEDYTMSSVLNDIMPDIRGAAKDGIELVFNVDSSVPALMNTDVAKLKKIIKALVSNALKFTNEGGVYLGISAEKHDYGVNLLVEVADTGIGMTEDELSRVYERFYQSDSGRARTGSGLGLGLSIVSGFVALLGGFMTISSRPGGGTTVRVSIPQTVIDDESCISLKNPKTLSVGAYLNSSNFSSPVVREFYNRQSVTLQKSLSIDLLRVESIDNLKKLNQTTKLTHLFVGQNEYLADKAYFDGLFGKVSVIVVADTGFEPGGPVRVMEKPFYAFPAVSYLNTGKHEADAHGAKLMVKDVKALVVDDEPMNIMVAKSVFVRYGMQVEAAVSGKESIDMCRKKVYDIIFMDHMMGQMDGVEAMKRIRTDAKGLNHETPVIALTANAMSSAKQMFLKEGFDGFVSKPIETEEFERTIKRVLPKEKIEYKKIEYISIGYKSDEEEVSSRVKRTETAGEDVLEFAPLNEATAGGRGEASFITELDKMGVATEEALSYFSEDEELYRELLVQFATDADERVSKLTAAYEQNDYKSYEITIHGTKSASRMIGFNNLSDEAMKLENAANTGDAAYIDANHTRVIGLIKKAGKDIEGLLSLNTVGNAGVDNDEVFEFEPDAGDDDVIEFAPAKGGSDDVMEFAPAKGGSDDVMEFAPVNDDNNED
ncbi:MAG: response regulator [Lachnospiraceae bacterium]|nr:response regulator [Lachnospiraceae bacterium]